MKNFLAKTIGLLFLIFFLFLGIMQPVNATTVLITEIEYDPIQSGTDTDFEWIELFNFASSQIDVSGWMLEEGGGGVYTFSEGVNVGSGSYVLLVNDVEGFKTNYPKVSAKNILELQPKLRLNNSGDSVLLSAAEEVKDFVAWAQSSVWNIAAEAGESVCRKVGAASPDVSDWYVCSPTPGAGSYKAEKAKDADVIDRTDSRSRDGTIVRQSGAVQGARTDDSSLREELVQQILSLATRIEQLGGTLPHEIQELIKREA